MTGNLRVGPAIAIALLARVWGRPEWRPGDVACWYLALLALGTPAYFVASFSSGMALADTYGIGGADHSSWAVPLYVASGLALIALAGQLVWNRVRPT